MNENQIKTWVMNILDNELSRLLTKIENLERKIEILATEIKILKEGGEI